LNYISVNVTGNKHHVDNAS